MNCIHCHKLIVLVPSAEERARKDVTGRPAGFYKALFAAHAACTLAERERSTLALLASQRVQPQQGAKPCSTS